jgi:hypothetical protein
MARFEEGLDRSRRGGDLVYSGDRPPAVNAGDSGEIELPTAGSTSRSDPGMVNRVGFLPLL